MRVRERKTARFTCLMTVEEKEALRRFAERDGVSLATALRVLLRTAARREGLLQEVRRCN